MLKKIIKLKDFGSFKNFEADSNLSEFQKYNLIWGLNGTGKTTLSRLFDCLNKGCVPDDYDKKNYKENFEIILNNNQSLKSFKENAYTNRIKIFNQDFINQNLTLDNDNATTDALTYNIGEEAKEIKEEIARLNNELNAYHMEIKGQKITKISFELEQENKSLEDIYRKAAEDIRRDLHISNGPEYNLKRFKEDFKRFEQNNVSEITDDEKNEYANKYIQPAKENIEKIKIEIPSEEIINRIKSILSNKMKRADLKEELVQWIEKGLTLKNNEKCPFCNQTIVDWENRHKEILSLVKKDDNFIKYENELKGLQSYTNNLCQNTKEYTNTIRSNDFFNKVTDEFLKNYQNSLTKYINFLEDVLQKISEKSKNPDCEIVLDDNSCINIYEHLKLTLNNFIEEHNNEVKNLSEIRQTAKNIVVNYYIIQNKGEINNLIKKIQETSKKNDTVDIEIKKIKQQIRKLNAELSNQKAPMEEIEKYISIVFGHNKFNLDFDELSKSYFIRRESGEIARNLSEGEKTVIAFAYFLATLKTRNFDLKNAIIIIDDPVSSLDQQYLFNLLNLLMNKFNKPLEFEQLFILTHNFYFFKKIRAILTNMNKNKTADNTSIYQIFQIYKSETSKIKNSDKYLNGYESEYTYTIKHLKNALKMEEEDIKEMPLGNSIRKILEIFLAFRCPKEKLIFTRFQKVTSGLNEIDKNKFKYLQDIANASSHTEGCEDLEALEEFKLFIGKDEINQLFEFIRIIDKEHFAQLP